MHLWHRVNMFLESIMFPLEWWIKWEICDVLYQLALVAKQIKFSGASKLHDPTTNMKLVQIKDKEKLNRIIKNQPITHVILYTVFIWNPVTFSKFCLWGKDIFIFYY